MKLHLNTDASLLLFTGYGDDHVLINGQRHEASLLLSAAGIEVAPWAGLAFTDLTAAHFEWVALRELDILLLGEVMDLGALCRTYNILAGEGRRVGAAVLLERA